MGHSKSPLVDDDEVKRRHVTSAMCVWFLFLPMLIAISALLIWISPYITKVPSECTSRCELHADCWPSTSLLIQLISLPESVLRGMNLGYKRMGWQAGLNLIGGALTVGALYLGSGLIGLAASQVILAAFTGVSFLTVVKKYVPWFGLARPDFSEVRSFLKLSVWWFVWTAVNKFLMASDILILGMVASALM